MSQSTTQHTAMRITRRGRLVLALLVASPVLAASLLFVSPGAQAGAQAGEVQYYTVLAGESLWDIAEHLAPERDPRDVIDALRSSNSLSGVELQPGQRLILPSGISAETTMGE